jgi:transposase
MEDREIKNEVMDYVHTVDSFKIVDVESFNDSARFLVNLASLRKKVVGYFGPMKKKAQEAHKAITSQEKQELAPIMAAEGAVKTMRVDWKVKQDKIAEQMRQRAEKAERERIAKEKEKLLRKAGKTKDPFLKEELIEKAEYLVEKPVIIPSEIEKTSKVAGGGTITWVKDVEVKVTDPKVVCRLIANGNIPLTVVEFKPTKLKAWVKSMDVKQGEYGGITIREIERESTRT